MMQQANECENSLTQQLHTLTSCTWQQQVDVIRALRPCPELVKLINHRNYSSEIAALFAAHNPRSKLITALTDFLVELFSTAANQMVPFANLLISNECLLRLLASGNKVISSSVNEIMKSIIANLDFRGKARQIKFVPALEQNFLSSKNNYVREKISLYFLLISTSYYYSTRETLADFERKVVKEGLQDANQKVRANMREILENIHHFEKQNNLLEAEKTLNGKNTEKTSLKSTKVVRVPQQNKSLKVLNSSFLNQSSIIESFIEDAEKEKAGMTEQSYGFYLERLRSGSTWSMALLSYESLQEAIRKGFLATLGSDQMYCDTLAVLLPLLNEKRSKIYESSSKLFNGVLLEAAKTKREKAVAFCQEEAVSIIEQVVKNESVAILLLPTLIALNPSFFIAKLAQISASSKVPREKLILLDSIVSNIHLILEETPTRANKRVAALVKAMCAHIEQATIKEKQISLAALAVISQLKSKHPEEVLTALLCQPDRSLSRIMELAESIDPSLKLAILSYISSLKSKRATPCHSKQTEKKPVLEAIEMEMILISQQQVSNLNRFGELVLTHADELDQQLYKKMICLLEFLYSSDLIMEYKILMEQLAKVSGREFLGALVEVLTKSNSAEAETREFHDILLLELMEVKAEHLTSEDSPALEIIVKCVIEVYRTSSSLKKRNAAVELLTTINASHLGHSLTEDELLLVETYRTTLTDEDCLSP